MNLENIKIIREKILQEIRHLNDETAALNASSGQMSIEKYDKELEIINKYIKLEEEKLKVINAIEEELKQIAKLRNTVPISEHEKIRIEEFIENRQQIIANYQKKLPESLLKAVKEEEKVVKVSLEKDSQVQEGVSKSKADPVNKNIKEIREKLLKDIQLNEFLIQLMQAAKGTMTEEEYKRKLTEHQNNLVNTRKVLEQLDNYINMRLEEAKISELKRLTSPDVEERKYIAEDIIRRQNLVEKYKSNISPELMEQFQKKEQISEQVQKMVKEQSNEIVATNQESKSKYTNLSDEELEKKIWQIKEGFKYKVADASSLDELRALREELKNRNLIRMNDEDKQKATVPIKQNDLQKTNATLEPLKNDIRPQNNHSEPVKENEALTPVIDRLDSDNDRDDSVRENPEPSSDQPEPAKKKSSFFKKALIASGGFVTGLGLSCVPGVGTIRMTLATAKLVISAAHAWSNKHPNGRIAKICDFVGQWKKVCPNIASDLENVKAKLKESPINIFINGISAGYITGNIFELLTGNTVLEAIQNANRQPIVTNVVQTQQVSTPVQTYNPIVNKPISVVKGENYDLSALEFGKVSSDAQKSVHLLNNLGRNAVFDKEVILDNGTKMWHFKQANGLGYAWFKADDVINTLQKGAEEVISSGIAR